MKSLALLFLLILVLTPSFLYAQDSASKDMVHSITLPPVKVELDAGEGKDATERYCGICHSLDYITTQPKLSKAQWTATVNKMVKVMGAPIPDNEARRIIDYLDVFYGTGQ
ncbi:MAG: c-type cytochrome [Dissulfurispiraceae bacterium]